MNEQERKAIDEQVRIIESTMKMLEEDSVSRSVRKHVEAATRRISDIMAGEPVNAPVGENTANPREDLLRITEQD